MKKTRVHKSGISLKKRHFFGHFLTFCDSRKTIAAPKLNGFAHGFQLFFGQISLLLPIATACALFIYNSAPARKSDYFFLTKK
jgi:hypothetical protein